MGIWTALLQAFGIAPRKQLNLICIGLDNSGKSTILAKIKQEPTDAIPTIGVQLEEFSRGKTDFTVFDMSGQSNYRDLWRHYYDSADAIVVVIDTTDTSRFSNLRAEIDTMLSDPGFVRHKAPILFFANKMDLGGISPVQCTQGLGLERIKDRAWNIVHCSGLTGAGLEEGLCWILQEGLGLRI